MPTGFRRYNPEIRARVLQAFPDRESTQILDVGAGAGKFRDLLHDYPNIDALEIWEPYLERYNLADRYREVCLRPAELLQRDDFSKYGLVIFGDVLEHLTVGNAQAVLERASEAGCAILVCVPYEMPQDEWEGNPHERHIQDDLTHELVLERYPMLSCLIRDETYGVYVRNRWREAEPDRRPQPRQVDLKASVEDLQKAYLAIATPCHGNRVSGTYVGSLWKTAHRLWELGISHDLLMLSGPAVDRSRNMMVANFMANAKYTHLLWIDSDEGWEPDEVLRLLALDREMIGAPVRKKTDKLEWTVNFDSAEARLERGAVECAEIGTGFTMVKRCVYEKMFEAYPDLKIKLGPDEAMRLDGAEDHYYALYQHALENGYYRSEDLTFCSRWRAIGGEVWCDPSANIHHIGDYDYSGSYASMIQGVKS